MTTSGTYAFAPSLGELVINAFAKCGVRRTALLQEHMQDARMEANLMLAEWDNRGPNLWAVDSQSVALVQGTATYTVPPETIMVLDAYITTGDSSNPIDRVIFPVSRTEYASIPDKLVEAPPTVFWFDRLVAPTITLWQVPDGNGPYTLNYYRVRQVQDAVLANGTNVEMPTRWLDAFGWGLAARLAVIYAPDRAVVLDQRAQRAWQYAADQDTENTAMYVQPLIGNYYVR